MGDLSVWHHDAYMAFMGTRSLASLQSTPSIIPIDGARKREIGPLSQGFVAYRTLTTKVQTPIFDGPFLQMIF